MRREAYTLADHSRNTGAIDDGEGRLVEVQLRDGDSLAADNSLNLHLVHTSRRTFSKLGDSYP